MTIDDTLLIAYVDGELGLIEARRVEREVAADPTLAARLAEHRALRAQIRNVFAPIAAEPVPNRLSALLTTTVVPFAPLRRSAARGWATGAIAASVALAIALAVPWDYAPSDGDLASGRLGEALDRQLASADGEPRLIVSFRNRSGAYCRVFAGRAADGIACREEDGWRLVRTRPGTTSAGSTFRQAGSANGALLAEAQRMMAGDPLDVEAEANARQRGWR